jgi:hypothetical protein
MSERTSASIGRPYDVPMVGSPEGAGAPRSAIRLSTVWIAAAFAVALTLAFGPISSIDLAYLVRAGRVMFDTGEVLRVDVFTFTAWCEPWLNQQWGAEIVVGGTFEALGWFGLALLRAALTAGVAASVYATCRTNGAHRRAAAWLTLLAAVLVLSGLQLRAQLFGLFLFAALRWIVAGRAHHPRRLWWAIPISLIWANLHGSFPLAILVLLFAWLEDRADGRAGRRILGVAALATLATIVTPFGPLVWGYVLDVSTDPLIREVVLEWRPPGLGTYTGVIFFVSVAMALGVFIRNRRALPWIALVELGFFLALAASSSRNVFWWGIVLTTTLSRLPWARREPAADPWNRANVVLLGALVSVPLIAGARWIPHASAEPAVGLLRLAPAALTEDLRSRLEPGEPFANAQSWGSWFELTLPEHPIFVDSRFEVVPPRAVRSSITISSAEPGWQAELDALPVRFYAVDREHQPALVAALPELEGWRQAYSDEDGLILVREGASPAPALPGCEAGAGRSLTGG